MLRVIFRAPQCAIFMVTRKKEFSFLSSFIKGETLFGGWGFVGSLIMLLNTYLIVSSLEVFHYGVYILIIAFFSLLSHLFLGPLQSVVLNDITRFIGEGDKARAKRLFLENTALQLISALVLSVAVFIGADFVASWYDEDVATLIRITSPSFFISVLYATMRKFFRAHLYFGIIAFRSIVYNIIRLIFLSLFLLFVSLNVKNALIAHVAASFVAMLVFIPPFLRIYAPWKLVKAAQERILWRIARTYGKWSLLGGGFKSSVLDVRPWLIKLFVNTEAVAIYSIAESLYGALKMLFPKHTLKTLIPHIVHDQNRTTQTLLRSIKYFFLYSILLGSFGAVAVPPLIQFLFPHYSESIPLFYILLLALPFLAFRNPTAAFLTASRRQRFLFIRQVIVFISTLALPLILLPLFGVVGMAIERVALAVAISSLTFWYLTRYDIPLAVWRGIFRFDKDDRVFFFRLIRLLQGWLRRKLHMNN